MRNEPGATSGLRCFVALVPDAASRRVLRQCRASLERAIVGAARGVRWVDPAALHLTLRFLGNADPGQIEYFTRTLPQLAATLPALATRRYGVWPNRARPRLVVLELEPEPILMDLAGACERLARSAGFEPEPRRFRAHVTLARLRPGGAFAILPTPPPAVAFDALALMHSVLAQPAARYRELARAPLRKTA